MQNQTSNKSLADDKLEEFLELVSSTIKTYHRVMHLDRFDRAIVYFGASRTSNICNGYSRDKSDGIPHDTNGVFPSVDFPLDIIEGDFHKITSWGLTTEGEWLLLYITISRRNQVYSLSIKKVSKEELLETKGIDFTLLTLKLLKMVRNWNNAEKARVARSGEVLAKLNQFINL